jgi:hypothetical protein
MQPAGLKVTQSGAIPTATPLVIKQLSQIDLSQIREIAPKGRVQDKDYNKLEVVDELLAHGKDSIPFLITKIEDSRRIDHHVFDFWPEVTVGDVAVVILHDFSTDSSSARQTIPGAGWEELLGKEYDKRSPFYENYTTYVRKHGRRSLKAKWERIWTFWEPQIFWDEKNHFFYASPIKY